MMMPFDFFLTLIYLCVSHSLKLFVHQGTLETQILISYLSSSPAHEMYEDNAAILEGWGTFSLMFLLSFHFLVSFSLFSG